MKQTDLLALMQSDVEDSTGATAPTDVVALGEEMARLREELKEKKAEVKEIQARYDEVRHRQLPEAMANAGLVTDSGKGKFTLSDGSTIYLASSVKAYVRRDDEGTFHSWLRANGHADLIRETVHHQTLRAFVREQLEQGNPLPNVVNEHHETSARIRRGR